MTSRGKWLGRLAPAAMLVTSTAAAAGPLVIDKGDTAWMLVSTLLVLLMIVPGLALFYGGLVRAKNLLSIFSQVMGITALTILVWVGWGYSLAFTDGSALVGGLSKLGLAGVGPSSVVATFSEGVGIPELVFVSFQMTFAAITAALIVGGLAERVRFSAIMLFTLLWLTIVYAPVAHLVWASRGLIFNIGALDFAGGTVVHVNSGVAGLIGVWFAGSRLGFQREPMPPHSLALSLVGAGLLWVGWFGFNAGSALEANGTAAVAMLNTFVAPAGGIVAWMGIERLRAGKPSLLGGASGAVAGLVGVTPAAGTSGPLGAILLGAASALACYTFIVLVKHRLKLDDSLDVFGIHGMGGIVGSVGTGIVTSPVLGGYGGAEYSILPQTAVQVGAVLIAIAWAAPGSALCFFLVKRTIGLRHAEEAERVGLDLVDHGERAYNL